MTRTSSEVKARCKPILARVDLVKLVGETNSPSAAFTVISNNTENEKLAKAGRWLAILRRDYNDEYLQLIEATTSSQANEARQERGER